MEMCPHCILVTASDSMCSHKRPAPQIHQSNELFLQAALSASDTSAPPAANVSNLVQLPDPDALNPIQQTLLKRSRPNPAAKPECCAPHPATGPQHS
jgi:hypothetical protein